MAILVVFSKWPQPKIQKNITLLVIDLYKQTWCQNIHFEGPEIQWRCFYADIIFTFASSGLFDYFLKGPPMKMHDLSNINECGSTSTIKNAGFNVIDTGLKYL